jgi:hypothetical protein
MRLISIALSGHILEGWLLPASFPPDFQADINGNTSGLTRIQNYNIIPLGEIFLNTFSQGAH